MFQVNKDNQTFTIDRETAVTFLRNNRLVIPSDFVLDLMVNFAGYIITELGGQQVK